MLLAIPCLLVIVLIYTMLFINILWLAVQQQLPIPDFAYFPKKLQYFPSDNREVSS